MYRRFVEAALCALVLLTSVPVFAGDVPYENLKWRSIGPAVSGGRATSVAGTDADALLYYAGAAGGGIWRTIDAGNSWTAVDESLPVNAIGAVTIAPSNKHVVWVGTGEANPRNDFSWGDGVWITVDGGKTWQHRGLEQTDLIGRILVDPHNANVALVAALGDVFKASEDRGVYRTADGGKTWAKTLYVGPSTGASDLAWDPRHPNVVFAGMWQVRRVPWSVESGGPDGGLYRSTDAGQTWTKLSANGLPSGDTGRIGIAVAPNHPSRVYALIQSKLGVLWRSDDGGDHWRLMSSDTLLNQRPFYFSRLIVDPTNQDHVIFLSQYVIESRDGGRTYKRIAKPTHEDNHDAWWSSDGTRLITANDGGASWSTNGGKDWSSALNMPIGQVYKLGYDLRTPYHVCGGLQDNTTFCGPSNSIDAAGILNRDWVSVNGGDGSFVWPDPLDPQLVWNAIENGVIAIFDLRSGQNVDIEPYPVDFNGMAIAGFKYRWNWTTPFAFSPQDPHVVYAGANVVFKTSNRGRSWSPISPDLTRNEPEHQQVSGGPINPDVSGSEVYNTITDIAGSPVQAGVLWTGNDDGLIHVTTDGGEHWKDVTVPGLVPYGFIQ
ncbi:MAG: glycosyl hydrolase, partial [Candidatus Eremiobacteraeota bacterium]|nr:glycosyl hydrolase [Candidatus Eremiobacteraeota bacterium]